MTKKYAPGYFFRSLNFKSHNFQTESLSTCVASTYRESTTLSFLVLQLRLKLSTPPSTAAYKISQHAVRQVYVIKLENFIVSLCIY
jgi:hypothetical protein